MTLSGLLLSPSIAAQSTPYPTAPHLVVILHGWGANAEDVAELAPALKLDQCHISIPNGPIQHPHSAAGRMWYDLESDQWPGLAESRQQLKDHLESLGQSTGIPLSRTFLLGFSQGGAMALELGLGLPLAGLVIFSGYLHPHLGQAALAVQAPLLIFHGEQDGVVPIQAAEQVCEYLKQQSAPFTFHRLSMGHEISPEALNLAAFWLGQRMGETSV